MTTLISPQNVSQITVVHNAKVVTIFPFVTGKEIKIVSTVNNPSQIDNQTMTTFANNVNNILFQRACADKVLNKNECSKKVHTLFDSGAQRSYITKELQKRLNLKLLTVESIVLRFLVRQIGGIMNINILKLKVKTVTDKSFMEALCIQKSTLR